MVLPSGFALPSLPYLLVVAAAVVAVGWLLVREAPPVTGRTVLAFAPWMVLGSTLYVCFQLGVVPDAVAPFAGSPTVYASTFAVAGASWLAARRTARPLAALAATGGALTVVPTAAAVGHGLARGTLTLAWPLAGIAAAAVVAAAAWRGVRRFRPNDAAAVGGAGALAVFAHVLDGTTTAVGVDVLGFGEQTPLSAAIMHAAADLPTASLIGVGWLFVLVKTVLGAAVVVLLSEYVREDPAEGNLLLAVVAAVGLGPGAHNVLLFVAANPAGF